MKNHFFIVCGGGELTIVEPNKKFTDQIKKNFNYYKQKVNTKIQTIEKFNLKKKYDVIILENFLSSINERNKNLEKVSKLLKNNGYLIFNYHNKIGFFNEYIKKFIISYYLEKKKFFRLDQSYNITKKLLYSNFNKITHSRSFKKYVYDQFLLNHNMDKTLWDIKDIFKVINKNKLRYYSSYPLYGCSKHDWHKDFKNNKKHNLNIYNKYLNEEKMFIDKKFFFNDEEKFVINKILNQMIKSCKKNEYEKSIKKIIRLSNLKGGNKYFYYLNKLFKKITIRSFKSFLEKTSWGHPNHYIVFRKV